MDTLQVDGPVAPEARDLPVRSDAPGPATPAEEVTRPTLRLPWKQLGLISAYWFGISAIWGGYEQFGQKQLELLVGQRSVGTVMSLFELLGAFVAIAVQPTIGTISDYTVSRFGRRKGYIISGAIGDLVFLAGLALLAMPEPAGWGGEALGSSAQVLAYLLLFLGLQTTSNLAQGPFQGYVPDLVPEAQVGVASGAIGVMRVGGLLFGAAVLLAGAAFNQWGLPLVIIGIVEVTLATLTFLFVREGPAARSRGGRSWRSVALEAWGTDVLRERSFLRMTGVRLLFLMGTGIFVNVSLFYVERSLGQTDPGWRSTWLYAGLGMLILGTVGAAIPAARLSDRRGRKPVIRGAAIIAAMGVGIIALAPGPLAAMPGILLLGIGSGAYLSVDWALMTEVIPLATSGRYMGLANIANSISGPIGLVIGGVLMDALTRAGLVALGPRVAVAVGVLALGGAVWLLRGVHPRRDPRTPETGLAGSGDAPTASMPA